MEPLEECSSQKSQENTGEQTSLCNATDNTAPCWTQRTQLFTKTSVEELFCFSTMADTSTV